MADKWTASEIPDQTYDEIAWRRLWAVSEELTGVRYKFEPTQAGA